MKSIISNEYQCLVCGRTTNLHRHHIFFGSANRAISELYGCWCYLCPRHHNASNYGVHLNHKLDLQLKQRAQRAWMEKYDGGVEDFIKAFGRNYLDE